MLVIISLLIACAFFTASEIAFVACSPVRLQHWAKNKNPRKAKFALNFLREQDKFLTTVLVGNNLTIVGLSIILAKTWYMKVPEVYIPFLAAFIILIWGEILPKAVASRFKEQLVYFFAKPYAFVIYRLFYPLIFIVRKSSEAVLRLFKIEATPRLHKFTREELQIISHKVLAPKEHNIISELLDFENKRINEVMVPRHRILGAPVEFSISQLKQVVSESGYSRIPLYESNIDQIIGLIQAKDLLTAKSVKDIIKPCTFVPETKKIKSLFEETLTTGNFFIIVKDEHGGTSGLVTREDLVEELFGEIQDEYDKLELAIQPTEEGSFLILGEARISDVEREVGIPFPKGDYETLDGFIYTTFDRIPDKGFKFKVANAEFEILDIATRRVEKLKVTKI